MKIFFNVAVDFLWIIIGSMENGNSWILDLILFVSFCCIAAMVVFEHSSTLTMT